MVLDFNGGALFKNQGLQQDGLLRERWAQEGSTQVDATAGFTNEHGDVYTVTAGKVLYVTNVIVGNLDTGTDAATISIEDDTTPVMAFRLAAGQSFETNPSTPYKFLTSFSVTATGASASCQVSFSGWEEDE